LGSQEILDFWGYKKDDENNSKSEILPQKGPIEIPL